MSAAEVGGGESAAEIDGRCGRTLDDLLAERFHETYERLAPSFGYQTRPESATTWAQVPEQNRSLMRAVIAELRASGHIVAPFPGVTTPPKQGRRP